MWKSFPLEKNQSEQKKHARAKRRGHGIGFIMNRAEVRLHKRFLDGLIDEVHLYNRVLSDEEVRMLAQNQPNNY
jgi:hypothetical protein